MLSYVLLSNAWYLGLFIGTNIMASSMIVKLASSVYYEVKDGNSQAKKVSSLDNFLEKREDKSIWDFDKTKDPVTVSAFVVNNKRK